MLQMRWVRNADRARLLLWLVSARPSLRPQLEDSKAGGRTVRKLLPVHKWRSVLLVGWASVSLHMGLSLWSASASSQRVAGSRAGQSEGEREAAGSCVAIRDPVLEVTSIPFPRILSTEAVPGSCPSSNGEDTDSVS